MSTQVPGHAPEIDAWLERRRALGQDGHDEVWDGDYHVLPPRHPYDGVLSVRLMVAIDDRASGRRSALPDDQTFKKFDFYAQHEVDELWVADPMERTVRCWVRAGSSYEPVDGSGLLDLSLAGLVAALDWP